MIFFLTHVGKIQAFLKILFKILYIILFSLSELILNTGKPFYSICHMF